MAHLSAHRPASLLKWIVLVAIVAATAASETSVPKNEENQQSDSHAQRSEESYRILEPLGPFSNRRQGVYPAAPETLRPKPETLSPGPLMPAKPPANLFYSFNAQPEAFSSDGMTMGVIEEPAGIKERINKQIEARFSAQTRLASQLQQAKLGAASIADLRNIASFRQRENVPSQFGAFNMGYDSSRLLSDPSARNQPKEPELDVIGGVGNPALMGVPIDLGNSNSFLVPSNGKSTTPKPVFGGVGDELQQTSPLVFGGSFGKNNKQFVSVGSQPRVQTSSPFSFQSLSSPSNVGNRNPSSFAAASSNPSASQANNFSQLVRSMQIAFANNPSLRNYMLNVLASTNSPKASSVPNSQPSGLQSSGAIASDTQYSGREPAVQQPSQQSQSAALLRQYYQQNSLNPAYQYQQNLPLRIPSDALSSGPSGPALLPADQPYFPAEHSPLNVVNSPPQLSEASILGLPSGDVSSLAISPVAASSVGYTNIQGCVKDTWCALALAAAVAVGATSALAVPFLAPAFLGRRRRDAHLLVFSQEEAPEFTNHFMRFMKGDLMGVPEEEVALFRSLQDPSDNRVKKMFENIRHFIVTNKDKLLNITIQEIKDEKHIPIPEDILQRISNKSRVALPQSIAMMLDPMSQGSGKDEHPSVPETLKQTNTKTRPLEGYIQEPDTEHYLEVPEYNPHVQNLQPFQNPVHASFTPGYHQSGFLHPYLKLQHSNHPHSPYPYNPYPHLTHNGVASTFGSPSAFSNHRNHLHFSAAGNRDSYPVNYHPKIAQSAAPQAEEDVTVIPLPASSQRRPLLSKEASAFYRDVCSAIGQDGVPDNDITRFIAQKCALFHFAGVI